MIHFDVSAACDAAYKLNNLASADGASWNFYDFYQNNSKIDFRVRLIFTFKFHEHLDSRITKCKKGDYTNRDILKRALSCDENGRSSAILGLDHLNLKVNCHYKYLLLFKILYVQVINV